MIDKLQAHYGFTRMQFGRDLAPGMLHRHAAHNEAVARITWCITERAIGVITGEAGAGKTASVRTVLAGLDPSRHTIIYLPTPMIGVRGLHETIVTTFGGTPDRSGSRLTAQASAILADAERTREPLTFLDTAGTGHEEETPPGSESKRNPGEAGLLRDDPAHHVVAIPHDAEAPGL